MINGILKLFSDYTFLVVAAGSALLGIVSGVLGSFAVLNKQSLLGDGISHSALPGVVAAFLLTGSKNTEALLLGALISGLVSALCITGIIRSSRIGFDSALALVMSVMFGIGMVLLTYVQRIPDASQAGLKRFIFGQTSALLERDVALISVCGGVILVTVVLFWKELKLLCFDSEYAFTLGFSPSKLGLLLSALIVAGIIIGLQTVGVILMSSMLITPAVAARQWTNRLWVMVLLAAVFGAVSGVFGTAASSLVRELPTGPAITLCVSAVALVSILFAPRRGVINKLYRRKRNRYSLRSEGSDSDVAAV
jgi:manganese/zinc/iron transport system permease protein